MGNRVCKQLRRKAVRNRPIQISIYYIFKLRNLNPCYGKQSIFTPLQKLIIKQKYLLMRYGVLTIAKFFQKS